MTALGTKALGRFAHAIRVMNRCVSTLGWRAGVPTALRSLRKRMKGVELRPVAGRPPVLARLGRGQSDFDTMVHVLRDGAYDVAPSLDPDWIIDAGANVGYASIWFAQTYPGARIVAIEPDPSNFELLVRNTALYPQVECVQAALADIEGSIEVFSAGPPDSTRVGAAGAGAGALLTTVPALTIDGLMSQRGIDRIGYLKIDIEGSELEVLRGSANWIDRVDVLGCELHDRFRPGCTRAWIESTGEFASELWRGENTFAFR